MENQPFDLDAFIAGIQADKSKASSSKDRLNRVLMNTRDNQGTNSFIPIISKTAKNIYLKLPRVFEYYGDTSLLQSGEAWYRVMPLEYYGGLQPDELELYNEVKSYLDFLNDSEECDRDELRVRNYALFTGINLMLKNTEGKVIESIKECPCLFIYPSNSVIDQLGIAINAKCDAMGGKKDWLSYIITPATKGRQGIMQISFVKAAGVGYDSTVNFEMNSAFNQVINPEDEISEDTLKLFDDIIPTFLGWIYDNQNKSYFNKVAFKELRDQLKVRVAGIQGSGSQETPKDANQTYENKNNLQGGAPQSEQPTAPTQRKATPF